VNSKTLLFPVLFGLLAVEPALASRTSAPGLPPGQAIKVTRADFKEKQEREQEREERLNELEERLEDSEAEREAKRIEREQIEAARQADLQAEAAKRAQAPEDFVGDAKKVVATAAPKTSSVNETAVTQVAVVAAAKKVVARRSR
jgi:hypothetical protein